MVIGLAIRRKIIYTIGLIMVGLGMSLYTGQVNAETTVTPLIGSGWNANSDVRYSPNPGTNLPFEYRVTLAGLETVLARGGFLSTDALTHHLNLAVGYNF